MGARRPRTPSQGLSGTVSQGLSRTGERPGRGYIRHSTEGRSSSFFSVALAIRLTGLLVQRRQILEVGQARLQPACFQPGVHRTLPTVALDGALGTLIGVAGSGVRSISELAQGLPALLDGGGSVPVLLGGR